MSRSVHISLITSTLGRTEALDRLLVSLESQSYGDFEIIVVDQNPDGFLDSVIDKHDGKLPLKRVRSGRGISHGRNVGLMQASGAILGFPDDDCWYGPDVLDKVARLFAERPNSDIIIGRTVDETGRNSIVQALPHDCAIDRKNVLRAGNSNAIFLRKRVLDTVGSFDENLGTGAATPFQSAEDMDFVVRAMANRKVDFVVDLTLFHEQVNAQDTPSHVRRVRTYAMGTGGFLRKHNYGPQTILEIVGKTLGGIPLRFLRGQQVELKLKVIYAYYLIAGYMAWKQSI